MPCTSPSPTLENPIPATYWPSAMASPAPASPATEPRSAPAMISMALRCSASSQSPGAAGEISFDSVRQGVHAGGRLQRRRHGVHHIGIDKGHLRDIMRIDADELTPLFFIGDDIVNRHLRRGTRGGRLPRRSARWADGWATAPRGYGHRRIPGYAE